MCIQIKSRCVLIQLQITIMKVLNHHHYDIRLAAIMILSFMVELFWFSSALRGSKYPVSVSSSGSGMNSGVTSSRLSQGKCEKRALFRISEKNTNRSSKDVELLSRLSGFFTFISTKENMKKWKMKSSSLLLLGDNFLQLVTYLMRKLF